MRKWFNSLKVSQKLMLISIFFMMPDTFMMIMFITGINADIQFAKLEQRGNEYQRPLEQLLDLIPEHRLLLQRRREGELNLNPSIASVEIDIDHTFAQLADVDRRIGTQLQFTPDALAVRGRQNCNVHDVRVAWESIRTSAEADADKAHVNLIACVRTMITHAGDNV